MVGDVVTLDLPLEPGRLSLGDSPLLGGPDAGMLDALGLQERAVEHDDFRVATAGIRRQWWGWAKNRLMRVRRLLHVVDDEPPKLALDSC